jgi:enoyl-CoA hydratase/carnithine racemase
MDGSSQALVRVHTENGITTVTLNQPERRNSLSMAMLEALQKVFEQLAQDPECRVVVLASAGKVFCAGHDLQEMRS